MNDPRQVRRLFAEALERPEENREAYLREACGEDAELRREVLSLLSLAGEASSFLEPEGMREAIDSALPARPDPMIGAMVGHYRVTELVARGGMGVVYRAEQERPQRSVALKLIRGGALSPDLVRRFEIETQVLGQLQHPGIAQIFEAGTSDIGDGAQPFFAMEYIEGANLIEYAEREKLDTAGRLELTIKLCQAVQHAHRKGVIHRDLKPANILVDRDGQPKILDFGGRTRHQRRSPGNHRRIRSGPVDRHAPYMSAEQVQGDSDQLDTRADVYSLGVVCYELLTGQLPRDLRGKTITEAIREITETDPRRLNATGRTFPTDLETIVAKALEGDRGRRYDSASELAADIRRFLADEPISAHPPSAAYQLRKFGRRNRALVTGLGDRTVGAGPWE